MSPTKDKVLIEQLKEGKKGTFRKIYDKYHKPLYGVAINYLKSNKLAEDAVHDVFLKLWRYRKKLKAQKSLKGFLFTSMKNHVLNMIRNHKREIEKNMKYSNLKPVSQNKTEAKITYNNYKSVFEDAREELPEGKREILDLKMTGELSNKEIAQKLDISVNTVKSQYYKASKFIKSQLMEHADLNVE